jgi:hypothetical protein
MLRQLLESRKWKEHKLTEWSSKFKYKITTAKYAEHFWMSTDSQNTLKCGLSERTCP